MFCASPRALCILAKLAGKCVQSCRFCVLGMRVKPRRSPGSPIGVGDDEFGSWNDGGGVERLTGLVT